MTQLKHHRGCKSSDVAEDYIEESMNNKIETANKLLDQTFHVVNAGQEWTSQNPKATVPLPDHS